MIRELGWRGVAEWKFINTCFFGKGNESKVTPVARFLINHNRSVKSLSKVREESSKMILNAMGALPQKNAWVGS